MDFEKLTNHVQKLEAFSQSIETAGKKSVQEFEGDAKLREGTRQAMRNFAGTLKSLLMDYLKERKEPIRTGQLYRDAAAKNFVPGDVGGDNLLIKWGGNVTPTSAQDVHDECARFGAVATKLLPVLKAYRKE